VGQGMGLECPKGGHRIPARGGTPGLPTGNRGVLKERRIHRGYPSARPGCGVPSERLRCINHPPRVATLGWYTPPRWGGTDKTLALLLEENVCKDPAKPWISNRQIHVGFGTVLTFGDLTVLRAMAAHLARRSVHAKWKTLIREKPTVAETHALFPGVPVVGSPDELFARHGWRRGPVKLRQLSQPADPHRPTNFLLKLRALFGMQARAEVMAYRLAVESGYPGEMAVRLAYFPRTLQTTLNDLARSGHLQSRREGQEKRFWLSRDDWRFLLTWTSGSGESAPEFPRWVDWASLFVALESVSRFLGRPDLKRASPSVQAIELRACLDTWDPAFLRENIHVPPGATGAAYVGDVLGDLHRLLK
jgi:hypothetical protein